MKKIEAIKEIIRSNRELLKERYKIKKLGIFGSYAHGKSRQNSDIDILVEFSESPDFFEFVRLEEFLAKLLHIKVDLVTRKALRPFIKNNILRETIFI